MSAINFNIYAVYPCIMLNEKFAMLTYLILFHILNYITNQRLMSTKMLTNSYKIYFMEEIFKQRLLEEIKNSKLTNKELAVMIGVSPEMITQYYTTSKLPRLDTFTKLCQVLNVSADYLLGLKDF